MPDLAERLAHLQGLEAHLRVRIRGQDHLLPAVAAAFSRAALGLPSPDRPLVSLLFVGPTGTGKSDCFACANEYVFGAGNLLTFDLAEYQDESALARLLGKDGHDPGLLGRALATATGGGLLFDEMEKAHSLVRDVMLQMLWHGRVTDATGRTHRFGRFVVGLTSNIGGAESMRMEHSKFASVEQATLHAVEAALRPELIGRIDEKHVFARLGPAAQWEICELEVAREASRLRSAGYDLTVSREAMELLIREGFDARYGARPLRKTVERQLQDAIVRSLFASGTSCGEVVPDPGHRRLAVRSV